MSDIALNSEQQVLDSSGGLTEAQFDIFGREMGWGKVRLVAEGYKHEEAQYALSILDKRLTELFGTARFGAPLFSIKRRSPVLQSDGLIKAGDLALVEFVGPKKLLSHGYSVYSTHWTIWKVIGVSSSGVDVEHVDGTRKMVKVAGLKCFDSSQLDEEAVWSNLMDRHARYIQDGFRCYMGGFFDGEKTVAHYLMGYLKPNSKTEINSDAVKKTLLTKSERFAKFMEQCI